jgi:hypothetical protein
VEFSRLELLILFFHDFWIVMILRGLASTMHCQVL